ncbi:tryptophan synthase subunit alpha [Tuwongella immobilis]|uniref:Tryptophan synthase alpha chain n=1 Tax=Tuwongella immobilis TaxID=692036 RepID=A0A6C2YPZ2_9BACT|nr:tryptophan synthase subunit alpha [Tuwongella immobilis]VIP03708.1 tryptophan synthase subunit alpha : Tryptophan synthase alpha chain OS=Planctomyces brasiliensis (strain ATCC 49424 / DSM 5305 / JCM 21570 / NBRC 103401 / IFAM 1448) GN=trpA PE=3 SV=1: Trp_syntA [Tuwongella immobilis]VTS04784.1 tryptophan synthase subunit alpha : Tryptophan synthase alpha chain OS=Planctomyces brasiliensis (strain ATCC 49424 / DSM 5305 / JCM 21570 / NBRC 103401 / IFAM 1448) GN=trpA PE=3 SV=1: Trp_syntA [Tuwonge
MSSNRIDDVFADLKARSSKAFMPFLTAGDPDLAFTGRMIRDVAAAGADLIEIGFPFSDPIADGPVIQASYTRALNRGVKIDGIFQTIREITQSPGWKTPLVAMVSYTLIFKRGIEQFLKQAQDAGLSGLIVPDMPVEEAGEIEPMMAAHGLKLILLVTPTTSDARARKIIACTTGFLYCVSVVGITGEREGIPAALRKQLAGLREITQLPLCVGFGISKPDQVHALREVADGVIVGSALVRKIEQHLNDPDAALSEIRNLVQGLAHAVHGG